MVVPNVVPLDPVSSMPWGNTHDFHSGRGRNRVLNDHFALNNRMVVVMVVRVFDDDFVFDTACESCSAEKRNRDRTGEGNNFCKRMT